MARHRRTARIPSKPAPQAEGLEAPNAEPRSSAYGLNTSRPMGIACRLPPRLHTLTGVLLGGPLKPRRRSVGGNAACGGGLNLRRKVRQVPEGQPRSHFRPDESYRLSTWNAQRRQRAGDLQHRHRGMAGISGFRQHRDVSARETGAEGERPCLDLLGGRRGTGAPHYARGGTELPEHTLNGKRDAVRRDTLGRALERLVHKGCVRQASGPRRIRQRSDEVYQLGGNSTHEPRTHVALRRQAVGEPPHHHEYH
jgi:hypothetical protein